MILCWPVCFSNKEMIWLIDRFQHVLLKMSAVTIDSQLVLLYILYWTSSRKPNTVPDYYFNFSLFSVSVIWLRSQSWSTRRSWCIVGLLIWRSGRTRTAHLKTCSLGTKWLSWVAISCWQMPVQDWPSLTTPRYFVQYILTQFAFRVND